MEKPERAALGRHLRQQRDRPGLAREQFAERLFVKIRLFLRV